MKKFLVFIMIFVFAAFAFANIRLDSFLLDGGEIADQAGDAIYNPALFDAGDSLIILLDAEMNMLETESELKQVRNNTDYAMEEIQETVSYPWIFAAKKFGNLSFGLNMNTMFGGGEEILDEYRINVFDVYTRDETTTNNLVNSLFELSGLVGFQGENFSAGLTVGISALKNTLESTFVDDLDSGNNFDDQAESVDTLITFTPGFAMELNFGRLLFSIPIKIVQNFWQYDWDGSGYETDYNDTGNEMVPTLGLMRELFGMDFRLSLGFVIRSVSREYNYYDDPNEATIDYEDKGNGLISFLSFTQSLENGFNYYGIRLSSLSGKTTYRYDADITDAAYEETTLESGNFTLKVFMGFERRICNKLDLRVGLAWTPFNNSKEAERTVDEADTAVTDITAKSNTGNFELGVSLYSQINNKFGLEISLSALLDTSNSAEIIDTLEPNDIDTSENSEVRFALGIRFN